MITKFPSSFNSLGLEIPGPITSGELVHWGELQNFPLLTNSRALGPQLSVDADVLLKGDPRELGRACGALLSVKGGHNCRSSVLMDAAHCDSGSNPLTLCPDLSVPEMGAKLMPRKPGREG